MDFTIEPIERYDQFDDCNVVRFRLNGTVYVATEDPDDGYRSHMRELVASQSEMTNVFPPLQVVGIYRNGGSNQTDDVLELIDVITGKVILEVGTRNTDDYYPYFVSSFHPESMAHNVDAKDQS